VGTRNDSPIFLLSVLIVLLSLSIARPGEAGPLTDTKVALHIKAPPGKVATTCTFHRPAVPCTQYSVEGDINSGHHVYLVTAQTDTADGVAGLSCGIDYDPIPGQGIDVFQWFFCSDGLEFPNAGPNGVWPAAGGGNRMTWLTCQQDPISPDDVHAIFGAFYVYAYGVDTLEVTENLTLVSGPEFEVVNCSPNGVELNLSVAGGKAAFSPGATASGYNPCLSGPSGCGLSTNRLLFGVVDLGETKDRTFTITNIFSSGGPNIAGFVSADCSDFQVVSGGGPFSLAPGESWVVTVRFAPTTSGGRTCTIQTGSVCPPMRVTGGGSGGDCVVSQDRLIFGPTALGEALDKSFTISNSSASANIIGNVSLGDCPGFEIVSGAGPYTLVPGQTLTVTIRFAPTVPGPVHCEVESGPLCDPIELIGAGGTPSGITPKLALHATAVPDQSQTTCTTHVPTIPCSQYETEADINAGRFVYLVVGEADSVLGLQALSCGIDYNPTLGQGVDVFQWIFCGDGAEFTNAGPNGEWPAAGGGNRMVWITCQSATIPPNGVHAVAGAFYVYAYGSDNLAITPNNNLQSGPELQTLDCLPRAGWLVDLDPLTDVGMVAFSPGAVDPGKTPCIEIVEATDVAVEPETLNRASLGNWVTAFVELPIEHDPTDVVLESVRILETVPADPSFPALDPEDGDFNNNGIADLRFKFDRTLFIEALPANEDTVEVTVTGDIGVSAMFVATDAMRIVRPQILSPNGGEEVMAGMFREVTWATPSGWEPVSATLHYSTDEGASWTLISDNAQDGSHRWRVPGESFETVLLRVQVYDQYGYLGKDESDQTFAVTLAVGIGDEGHRLALLQNAPNPFGGSTVIRYTLPAETHVTLSIFNVRGQRVRVLESGMSSPGVREVRWDGLDEAGNRVASGLYLYRLQAGKYRETRRMLLIR
jgi:hypothetical protein